MSRISPNPSPAETEMANSNANSRSNPCSALRFRLCRKIAAKTETASMVVRNRPIVVATTTTKRLNPGVIPYSNRGERNWKWNPLIDRHIFLHDFAQEDGGVAAGGEEELELEEHAVFVGTGVNGQFVGEEA